MILFMYQLMFTLFFTTSHYTSSLFTKTFWCINMWWCVETFIHACLIHSISALLWKTCFIHFHICLRKSKSCFIHLITLITLIIFIDENTLILVLFIQNTLYFISKIRLVLLIWSFIIKRLILFNCVRTTITLFFII